jgi:hypothetical protein
MRWWLSTVVAEALAPRVLTVVTIPSHHKQWGKVSFEIRGERGRCYSNSLKVAIVG